jgi:hypothetical protein
MADEKILEKLGKIKAHMESAKEIGNEKEAEAFASMLNNMLARHKLEMTDIQYTSHLKEEPVETQLCGGGLDYRDGKKFYKNYPDVEVVGRRIDWVEDLAGVIARAHSCETLIHTGLSAVTFVGRKSDIAVAEFLFITMMRTAESLAHKEYMKLRRQLRREANGDKHLTSALLAETHGYKSSFLSGFILRLAQRFREEKKKMEHDFTGTALMRINKEALAVREYIQNQKNIKSAPAIGQNKGLNDLGYQRGKEVADSLNLKANAMNGGAETPALKGGN